MLGDTAGRAHSKCRGVQNVRGSRFSQGAIGDRSPRFLHSMQCIGIPKKCSPGTGK